MTGVQGPPRQILGTLTGSSAISQVLTWTLKSSKDSEMFNFPYVSQLHSRFGNQTPHCPPPSPRRLLRGLGTENDDRENE